MAYQGGQPGNKRRPDPGQVQRAREQQAVLNNLRKGGVLSGAQPVNPFARIRSLLEGYNQAQIPNLRAAELNGEEILINTGGYTRGRADLGPIRYGGQQFFPAQRGKDLVYRRGVGKNDKRAVGGQFGSILPKDSTRDSLPDPYIPSGPEERSYQQEVSRIAQLTAQDPELKRYEDARKKAAAQGATPESVKTAEDIGMQIWAKKYGGPGGLASKVKPGQAGYEAIQGVLAPGRGMPGSTSLYQGAFPGDDYRDYGEPPTGAAAIPGFNTPAITGVADQIDVRQFDPAQMQAQDLVESFKKGVFDPDLMEQIASSIYNR